MTMPESPDSIVPGNTRRYLAITCYRKRGTVLLPLIFAVPLILPLLSYLIAALSIKAFLTSSIPFCDSSTDLVNDSLANSGL